MIFDPAEVVAAMFERDAASRLLGIEVVEAELGRAVLRMQIRPNMVNGLDVCHGGFIFTLADSAMACSSNSSNQFAFATGADIDWVNPGRLGQILIATATERHLRGRSAITDVVVADDDGEVIALFRGRTRLVDGQHLT